MKEQSNHRLETPYKRALQAFPRKGTAIIEEALDNSPHQPFRKELAKAKEAYGSTKEDNTSKDHPDAEAIREEFTSN